MGGRKAPRPSWVKLVVTRECQLWSLCLGLASQMDSIALIIEYPNPPVQAMGMRTMAFSTSAAGPRDGVYQVVRLGLEKESTWHVPPSRCVGFKPMPSYLPGSSMVAQARRKYSSNSQSPLLPV